MSDIPFFDARGDIPEHPSLTENARRKRRLRSQGIALGPRWKKLRDSKLRQYPVCECCGNRPAQTVHHIIARVERPDLMYDWSNLQSLCNSCHVQIHKDYRPRSNTQTNASRADSADITDTSIDVDGGVGFQEGTPKVARADSAANRNQGDTP